MSPEPVIQTTLSPHSQQPYVTRTYPTESELDGKIARAVEAQKSWKQVPLEERIAIGRKFMVGAGNPPPFKCSASESDALSHRTSLKR